MAPLGLSMAFYPVVELGLTASTAGVFLLDSSLLDGADALAGGYGYAWTDVTNDVVGAVQCNRGATQGTMPVLRYDGGSVSFELDNQDGRYDPTNASGPFYGQIRPGVAVRVSIVTDSMIAGPWSIFRGVVASWQPTYPSGDLISTVAIVGEDLLATLVRADLPALDTAVGAGDTAAQRIGRLADRAGWPTGVDGRVFETTSGSIATMQATTGAQPVWTEMLLAADSDCGFLWLDGNGRLRYTGPMEIPSAAQTSFDMGSALYPHWDEIETSYDLDEVFNTANVARVGGSTIRASDEVGIAESGVRAYTRTDLICESDDQVERVAQWVVFWRGRARYRIATITHRGTKDLDHLLICDLGDRIKCVQHTPDGRNITVEGLVRGFEYRIHPAVGVWETKVHLQSIRSPILDAFVLDSSLLDSAKFLVP